MKKNTKKINEVADYVIQALLNQGVIIQRYDAYSTNSVYLKFDCGMANSLRIGDHKGKKHLNYMFKVDVNYSGPCKVEREKFTQYTYGSNKKQLDKLIKHILDHRERKVFANFGNEFYKESMKKLYKENKTQVGFWSQATFIKQEVTA